ncbi:MAG: ribulose-phosphate 3-epimerase [Clostridia bacterium]|nr:ribulose-phosphate 3-epimerase [Clostridia bacterium]
MKTLSPSILAANMLSLGDEIKKIEYSGSNYVHIDVMDGVFVPNISFGMPVISATRKATNLALDVHAMIIDPDKYIDDFIKCGADIITFHFEALDNNRILKAIEKIHTNGKKVGLSIKPKTPANEIYPYLDLIDMVLVMTVEPGFGGQSFMYDMMVKVTDIREYSKKLGRDIDIEVDGGINNETIKVADKAGANIFVLGTAFFKSEITPKVADLLNYES